MFCTADECFRNLLQNRPELNPEALQRTRDLMKRAVPDCMVTGYEELIDALLLPDPDDRHVLAAAIRAGAQTIVTFNLVDFPVDRLGPYNIEAKHPDDFVMDTIDLSGESRQGDRGAIGRPEESAAYRAGASGYAT